MIGLAFQAMQMAETMRVSERFAPADFGRRLETFGRAQRSAQPERVPAGSSVESDLATESNA